MMRIYADLAPQSALNTHSVAIKPDSVASLALVLVQIINMDNQQGV